jgi:hypothetical protein
MSSETAAKETVGRRERVKEGGEIKRFGSRQEEKRRNKDAGVWHLIDKDVPITSHIETLTPYQSLANIYTNDANHTCTFAPTPQHARPTPRPLPLSHLVLYPCQRSPPARRQLLGTINIPVQRCTVESGVAVLQQTSFSTLAHTTQSQWHKAPPFVTR